MRIRYFFFIIFSLLFVLSCNKETLNSNDMREIVIGCGDDFQVSTTKASASEIKPADLPGMTVYWGASSGSPEAVKWSATSATVSGASKINTGKYQTATPTSYNYYVANKTFTVGGNMTVENNNTDIIAGRTASSTSTTPTVVLNHIFARTGTLTCNTQDGYSISDVSWMIASYGSITGTAGTFNMVSQTWTARSASLSERSLNSSDDLYLIPGVYTIKVTYTLSKGDYSQTFTKQANVTLAAGYKNNIRVTAVGGNAQEIVMSLSLSSWTEQTLTPTLSNG